ncbi:pectate lyase [Hymenobacter sp. BT175]|uniref:pectate lyase n=1 Tax=Hymenobacter translucens TaxID=2886507 RepID=UPI001D0F00C5|nr:pectate lyase [Hymenobacter translucens]MCC2548051.1 pectate lyase [Hymenobacter translucens]
MRWSNKLMLLLTGGLGGVFSAATAQQVTVAADGSGKFRTIQQAVASLPDHAEQQRVILIKNGTYKEKVVIDGKDHLTLRGQSEKGVVITISQANAIYSCNPATAQDWRLATISLRNSPDITLEKLTVLNTYGAEAPAEPIVIDCPTDPTGKRMVKKTDHQMALYTTKGTTRLVVKNCTFRTLGNDTVSPWDGEAGLYYFKNCTMEGSVDFYCPRGWAYAENCRFICHNKNAAIWHDGTADKDAKTVLKNCTFEGDDNFKLGRFHRESQFYLIDCKFPKNMADADIYAAPSGNGAPRWGRRVYYSGCHRTSGDYAWHQDNLNTAENAPSAKRIDADWTFAGRWKVAAQFSASETTRHGGLQAAPTDSIAERMLLYQRAVGGWPKAVGSVKVSYDRALTPTEISATRRDFNRLDATIDNNATTREITYLVKAFKATGNPAYRDAAEKGIRFLLKMQYPNGGFPQYYPDLRLYRHLITYNDNAMIRALGVLRDVATTKGDFAAVSPGLIPAAKSAVDRGIDCILKTQYRQKGVLTAWCAQHDEKTLLPANARAFELASLSGLESVEIVRFLMGVENPSAEVVQAVNAAVTWFNKVKLAGYTTKIIDDPKQPKGKDRVIVPEAGSTIWARFYDLNTNQPIYVGRDGEKRASLAEIEVERRVGYAYAGVWPEKLLAKDYPRWRQKWSKK